MKLNVFETHDRLQHLIKHQSQNIFLGAEQCLKENPLSLAIQEKCPYIYIWAHPRSDDFGINKRMIWQPRLSIPKAQTNSYLFRAVSFSDIIEIVWMLPPREQWSNYSKGQVNENEIVEGCINMFKTNRKEMEKPHPEDFSEDKCKIIMKKIIQEHLEQIQKNNSKPKISEVSFS